MSARPDGTPIGGGAAEERELKALDADGGAEVFFNVVPARMDASRLSRPPSEDPDVVDAEESVGGPGGARGPAANKSEKTDSMKQTNLERVAHDSLSSVVEWVHLEDQVEHVPLVVAQVVIAKS